MTEGVCLLLFLSLPLSRLRGGPVFCSFLPAGLLLLLRCSLGSCRRNEYFPLTPQWLMAVTGRDRIVKALDIEGTPASLAGSGRSAACGG